MKYTGKYKKMVEQFRKDGADEALIEKFIREEMERDAFEKENGTTDLQAYRVWKSWPEERRDVSEQCVLWKLRRCSFIRPRIRCEEGSVGSGN